MARNGRRRYSSELVQTILDEHINEGKSYRVLSKKYHVPQKTIVTWVHNMKIGKDVVNSRKLGRVKKEDLTKEDYKERYEILKKYQAFLQARRGKK